MNDSQFWHGPCTVWWDETHVFRDGELLNRLAPVVPIVPFRSGRKPWAESVEDFNRAWAKLFADFKELFEPFAREAARRLEPPANVMERALAARRTRNTGPARPSGPSARRPRRHN